MQPRTVAEAKRDVWSLAQILDAGSIKNLS